VAGKHVNPTRMELTNLKRKLVTAIRGHKLLKDKRDELMRQFLEMVQKNRRLRERVEEGIASANKNFVLARAVMQDETLKTAFLAPKQEVYLDVSEKNVMSVEIPRFTYKTRTSDPNDIYSYGYAFTSGDLDSAVKSLADILPDMLRLFTALISGKQLCRKLTITMPGNPQSKCANSSSHLSISKTIAVGRSFFSSLIGFSAYLF
jgi:V/A-type H+-transporting ATPase subunit D